MIHRSLAGHRLVHVPACRSGGVWLEKATLFEGRSRRTAEQLKIGAGRWANGMLEPALDSVRVAGTDCGSMPLQELIMEAVSTPEGKTMPR